MLMPIMLFFPLIRVTDRDIADCVCVCAVCVCVYVPCVCVYVGGGGGGM